MIRVDPRQRVQIGLARRRFEAMFGEKDCKHLLLAALGSILTHSPHRILVIDVVHKQAYDVQRLDHQC